MKIFLFLSGWIIKVIVSSLLAEYDNERNKQSILSAMNIIKLTSLFKSIGTIHMYVCVEKVKYLTCLHFSLGALVTQMFFPVSADCSTFQENLVANRWTAVSTQTLTSPPQART